MSLSTSINFFLYKKILENIFQLLIGFFKLKILF